jgi:hypothetical protein
MSPTTPLGTGEQLDARAYRQAHRGKVMVIVREEGRKLSADDFFQFDDAGTHPTGLFVTGIFSDKKRGHLLSTRVRDASEAEIAWNTAALAKQKFS